VGAGTHPRESPKRMPRRIPPTSFAESSPRRGSRTYLHRPPQARLRTHRSRSEELRCTTRAARHSTRCALRARTSELMADPSETTRISRRDAPDEDVLEALRELSTQVRGLQSEVRTIRVQTRSLPAGGA